MTAEIVMPHALRTETDSVYKARVTRYTHRQASMLDTVVFQSVYSDYVQNCIVGREVAGNDLRLITGAEKYVPGYFDVLLKAMLLKIAPDGHSNIVLSIAHPPDATPQLDALIRLVGGKHTVIRHDGQKVSWNVMAVVPFDEPAGGLTRAMTTEYAAYNEFGLDPGDKVMIVDIGGKISSMTPALMVTSTECHTLWNDGSVFELGIQDVKDALDGELRALHPDVFRSRVPDMIVEKAIRGYGQTEVQGRAMDVKDAFNLAADSLLGAIRRVYVNDMRRAQDVTHIFISGGGGGLLENALREDVFDHTCSLADNLYSIHLANLRGGVYAFKQWVAANQNQPGLHRLFTKAQQPLFVACDLGNSNLKGTSFHV